MHHQLILLKGHFGGRIQIGGELVNGYCEFFCFKWSQPKDFLNSLLYGEEFSIIWNDFRLKCKQMA